MRKFIAHACLVIVLVFGNAAGLQAAPSVKDDGIAKLSQELGFEIRRSFSTPAPGVTGYVVTNSDGKPGIVYGLGNYVLSGSLLDSDGNDLTRQYAQTEIPKPDYAAAASDLAKDSTLVTEGKAGQPEIFVFADPNCGYCHRFWKQTRDWVENGQVQIHWIMVGFLKSSSTGYAAAIINADSPVRALTAFESSFGKQDASIKALEKIPENLQASIDQHGQLMAGLKFSGTPALLFKNATGDWQGLTGVPDQSMLGEALGIGSNR